jgi:hypothetical protein
MRRSYPTPPRPCLMRAEHVNPDRVRAVSWRPGRPTVRRVEFSGGNRMSKKRECRWAKADRKPGRLGRFLHTVVAG